ncbi:MAG TPA: hypothetical protein VK524_18825 [Polyangiaceae bacterium]|nr:hypothetical protein [Polyangiaceae bacterium]
MARRPKKASARSQRRSAARAGEKLATQRRRLARLELGGTPERPIQVPSASVIEVQALARPCLACEALRLRVLEHRAEELAGVRLRVVDVSCAVCAEPRRFFFEIANVGPN